MALPFYLKLAKGAPRLVDFFADGRLTDNFVFLIFKPTGSRIVSFH